jgi:hypothetical protein
MWFWSVQVIQNCNWNYDVEQDGCFVREIHSQNDLSIFEEISLTRDKVCFFLSSFPGNILSDIFPWTHNNTQKKRNQVLWFFDNRYGIKYLASTFEKDTLVKFTELYENYTAFFDDISKLKDPYPSDSCIVDSWIIFNKDWGFTIYRISKWTFKEVNFTQQEYHKILSHW